MDKYIIDQLYLTVDAINIDRFCRSWEQYAEDHGLEITWDETLIEKHDDGPFFCIWERETMDILEEDPHAIS